MSAADLFIKYSQNFPNFSLDILVKYILTKKLRAYRLTDNSEFLLCISKFRHSHPNTSFH